MSKQDEFISRDLSSEAQLLLCCARTQIDAATAERICSLLRESIDWSYLLQMATRHDLAPLLYLSLDTVAPTAVPATVRAELKEQVQGAVQRNLLLTKELVQLLTLFSQQGVAVLPYKGPALAAAVYGDLALRPFSDLDLLVHEADILQALDLLIACGYEVIRPPSLVQTEKRLQALTIHEMVEKSLWAYQLVLWRPDRRVVVELHWRILPKYVFPHSPVQLWRDLKPVTLGGVTTLSFAPENLLWFLCLHAAKHQWRRLSWLCDIAELIRSCPNLNWEQSLDLAAQFGIERRFHLGLFLANWLLQTPLPPALATKIHAAPHVKALARQVVDAGFDDEEQPSGFPYLERFAFQLRAMDRMVDRGRYLLRFAKGIATAAINARSFVKPLSLRIDVDKRDYRHDLL